MEVLTFNVDKDRRNLTNDVQNFDIDFKNSPSWVQARQYENQMRQVQVNVQHGDGTPFDLTGANPVLEGFMPDGVHRIIDAKHGVMIDPVNGQFRFDFPAPVFAVSGSYKQIFFRLYRAGKNIATLEFSMEVLADKVISGLIPADYVTPIEDIMDKAETVFNNATGDIDAIKKSWAAKLQDLFDSLSKTGKDTADALMQVQAGLTALEAQIKSDGLMTITDFNKQFEEASETINAVLKTVTGYVDTARNSSWIYNNIKPLAAHRGAHIDAPENTAMAVAHAGMYGYGLIECDPRLTSDNQVVLMHDDTVDRMTDGAGKVSDFTLDQLKQMTVDAAFSGKNDYNTIRVPTLAEILHEVNQYGMGVNIDGGKLDWQDDNVINTVVGIIKQAGLMGRSFFVISDPAARKRLNALYPEAALSWLSYDSIDNYIAEAKTYTNAVISIDYENLSRDYSAIAASGFPLHVYNVNSASQYDDSVQHGARFIETDSLLPMTVTQA